MRKEPIHCSNKFMAKDEDGRVFTEIFCRSHIEMRMKTCAGNEEAFLRDATFLMAVASLLGMDELLSALKPVVDGIERNLLRNRADLRESAEKIERLDIDQAVDDLNDEANK